MYIYLGDLTKVGEWRGDEVKREGGELSGRRKMRRINRETVIITTFVRTRKSMETKTHSLQLRNHTEVESPSAGQVQIPDNFKNQHRPATSYLHDLWLYVVVT